ncbi:MAG: RraA family protein [Chloroflexi bacterium]|jgi:regulator of RNase E activity RraA|nr:RraA family protein [Chloroflexota bacterium]
MVAYSNREEIIQITSQWKGDRFDDGRPRVPDEILQRLRALQIVTEEAWSVLWHHGYERQFEGNWVNLRPDRIMIGRAVTATFVPHRPDLHDELMSYGHEQEGRIGAMNSWVIETLQKDDVPVIDLFGKVYKGTFSGANLSTAIATRTGVGQVIYGGIRDAQQILEIPDFCTFCKGVDPTPIRDVTLVGLNTPCRIGDAICLPGDIVIGTYSGVLFVPPHLAEEVLEHAERTHLREVFSHMRLREGIYTSSQMDTQWTDAITADFDAWRATQQPAGAEGIDWSRRSRAEEAQSGEETTA